MIVRSFHRSLFLLSPGFKSSVLFFVRFQRSLTTPDKFPLSADCFSFFRRPVGDAEPRQRLRAETESCLACQDGCECQRLELALPLTALEGPLVPSRVQPSPCDTLSVTDPLHLVTWHPLRSPPIPLNNPSPPQPLSRWPFRNQA